MKYILIFLFALLCSVGYAQNPISQYIGAPTTTVISRGALKADSSLILPQFPDTIAANRSPYIKFYPGNLIRVFNDIYMRNTTATKWELINGGGTGGNNFIDSLRKVGDSVYARKYGIFVYQYTDSAQNILANNGLSFSGDTLQLGGTLTKNTTINADSNEVRIDTASKFIVTNGLGLNHIYTDSTVTRLNVKSAIPGEQNQLQLYLGDKIDYEPQRQSQIDLLNIADGKSARLQVANYEGISLSAYEGGNKSEFNLNKDSITISPNDGVLNIDSLKSNSDTIGYYPLKWNATTGKLEAYSDGFAGLTPNLQQVTNTGNSTTQNIKVLYNNNSLEIGKFSEDSVLSVIIVDTVTGINYYGNYNGGGFSVSQQNKTLSAYPNVIQTNDSSKLSSLIFDNSNRTPNINYQYYMPFTSNNNSIDTLATLKDIRTSAIDTNSLRRVKYVGLTMPSAFNVVGSPITDSGTIAVTGAGTASQYVRGDGVLASFPTATTGGGASVSYYLNGSVNKGTFGGQTYYEMSRTAIIGAGTDFTRTNAQGDGLVAQFITDTITNLLIPAGNWNLELYFNASSGGGTPSFYVELYKYDGTNFTLISSNSTSPELIAFGTTINPYFCALTVPETILSGTDRLAIRVFVNTSGRSITLHTENSHLCQVITTFTTGLTAINGLTKQVQYFATGTSGTDFNISSSNDTHTFNLPTASATNRGALSSADWSTFNGKLNPSDTISLSNRINTKLNISDTSTMLSPYLRSIDTTNKYVTSVFRKTASDSVFFVRGGTNNFAFRDSAGGANIYNTDGSLTSARTLSLNSNPLTIAGTTSSRFFANGNVGIGTTTDGGFRLDVNGSHRIDANLRFNNNGAYANGITSAYGSSTLGLVLTGSGSTNDITLVNRTGNGVITIPSNTYNTTFAGNISSSNLILGNGRLNDNGATLGTTLWGRTGNANISLSLVNSGGTDGLFLFENGNVNLGSTSSIPSAQLSMTSTTKGFLQPRLTTTQMNAISTPATGLSVFNTTDSLPYVYRGTSSGWQKNVTYTRTNDIGLLNGADQRLMIEPTTNVIAGRALTVEAGSTQAGGTSAFQALSQTTRAWRGMATAPNGDVYAVVGNGDIYRRAGGIGNFTALSAGNRAWRGIAVASNGDIYATVDGGDIWKSTNGGTTFTALSAGNRAWWGITVAPNGDVYASVYSNTVGDIYISTNGGTTFTALSQTARFYTSMTALSNGDIYVAVDGGDIFRRTGGTGNFVGLGQTSRFWYGISAASNNDIYACVANGDIYKQTNATGTFAALNQTSRSWNGITVAPNGDIYASVTNGDIYLQSQGTANLNGGALVLQSGVGKGTGTSTINFNTGTTLTSGATLQTASTKMTILGNGNVGIGTASPSAKLELSDTARGFLQTRMTTTQRNNIASPSVGLQVFTTTDSSQYVYRGTGAGWQQLANEIVNTGTLDFPSTNAQNSTDLTITLTGAVDGDAVVLGVPNAAINANSCYTAWVSASGVVTVRLNNYGTTAIDPAQATFKVTIIK